MDFFGITLHGSADPIKFYLRPDYKEPVSPPSLIEIIEKGTSTRPFQDAIREIDIYNGILDGWSYRSNKRIELHKKKSFLKSQGPVEMYTAPILSSMEYGWYLKDPALEGKDWYKKDVFMPLPSSEISRFLEISMLKDKTLVL